MKKMRPLLVLAVAAGWLLIAGGSYLAIGAQDAFVGEEVGRTLGLVAQPTSLATDCKTGFFAEFEDGAGYCVDAETRSELEAWELAVRITGRVPTDLDREVFLCSREIEDLYDAGVSNGDPAFAGLIEKCLAARGLLEEQQASSGD